jgi:hypothetical protein
MRRTDNRSPKSSMLEAVTRCFSLFRLSWRSSLRRFVSMHQVERYLHTDYDPVGYKVAMGAAQSAPISSPNVSAASDSVFEVNSSNPKGLKPYAIRSI